MDDGVGVHMFDKSACGVEIRQREFLARGADSFVAARSKRFHDIVAELARDAGNEDFHTVFLSHSRFDRSRNFVNSFWKKSSMEPIGPLRCFEIMTSVMFFFSVSWS